MENISTKCLIIGSGPAGYTAAIYASRANLSPILFEGMQPGGQLTTTSEIENFPGYPEGIGGFEMMDELRQQAERFGTDVRDGEITAVDFSKRPFTATTDDGHGDKSRHRNHCHWRVGKISRHRRRAALCRTRRVGMRHLRRFLLSQPESCGHRRRQYRG